MDKIALENMARKSGPVLAGTAALGIAGYFYRKRKTHKATTRKQPVLPRSAAPSLPAQPPLRHDLIELAKLAVPLLITAKVTEPEPAVIANPPNAKTVASAPTEKDAARISAQVARIAGTNVLTKSWQMSKAAVNAWLDDFAPSMGAAIAYYTIFSIAPMLVIAIAIAGFVFGQEAAQGEIVNQLRGLIGTEGAVAVQGLLKSANEPAGGAIATVLSVITLAIGATAVFAELQSALDRIWRVPVATKQSGIWTLIRTRLLSFGLVLGLGFILIVSLMVSAGLSALGNWWGAWFAGWNVVLQILNLVISVVVFTVLFAVIYKFMPSVRLSWHDVWIGAFATTALFTIGKYLIALYLGKAGMTSGFGAAGSMALLLAWIYYSAQIFLLGAEFTWIYANNFGSRVHVDRAHPAKMSLAQAAA